MATSAEDFIRNFHSLEGITIGQRRKNFFKLLQQSKSLKTNTDVLDAISTNLIPKTYLEELFKVELLIYFRRGKELFQLLKEGNDIFVCKITKQKWFFQETFVGVEAEELVNDILPSMSYSVRMKVLKKLSRYANSEHFDKIFDAVEARYGIFIARKFVGGCSPDKVRGIVEKHRVELTFLQLKVLYAKDATFIEFYLRHTNFRNKKFFQFLFIENPKLFHYLTEIFYLQFKHGRRLTKKIIKDKRDDIITSDPCSFSDSLCIKTVIRKLGRDAVRLFRNTLPSDFNEVHYVYSLSFLRCFPKKYHYDLIFKVVPDHYDIKFVDYPEFIDETLLELEPDREKRAVLAKVKVDEGLDEYIKYLNMDEAVALLKEKINVTADISQRDTLINYLVETYKINKDLKRLFELLKYFSGRHKNDDAKIVSNFLYKIESLFDFQDFNEEMWNLYYDVQITHILKNDEDLGTYKKIQTKPLSKFFLGGPPRQHFSYLHFLYEKNVPIDEFVEEFFSEGLTFPEGWGVYSKNFEKYMFMYVINKAAEKELDDVNVGFNCTLIDEMKSWNSVYPDDQFDFIKFPFLLSSFNYALNNFKNIDNREVVEIFNSKIFTTTDNEYRDEYLKIYWKRLTKFKKSGNLKWFLKYDPLSVEKFSDDFFDILINRKRKCTFRNGLEIIYLIKKFRHLRFDQKCIEHCLSNLNDENYQYYKPQCVSFLSVLMKPEEYVSFADSYKPAKKKVDLKNDEERKLYHVQCAIGKNFKNTKHHSVLPSLFNYCVGDYFHYSLRSLYSILYRTPENLLPQYMNQLATKAVSVRKHALYLTCELTAVEQVENTLKLLNKSEGVMSLRKYMFSSSLKYFLKNPLDQFFELVKSNLSFITKEDSESQKLVVKRCEDVPVKYRCQYIQHSWEHFEKIIEKKAVINNLKKIIENKAVIKKLKNDLLKRIITNYEVVQSVPLAFGLKIIQDHFIPHRILHLDEIARFTVSFLTKKADESLILDTIFGIVGRFGCSHYDVIDTVSSIFDHFQHRKAVQCFRRSWEHFEKTVNEKRDLITLKNILLRSMLCKEIIKDLPLDFGFRIFQQHFFSRDEALKVNEITEFAFYFTMYKEEKDVILNYILGIVDQCEDTSHVLRFFKDWKNEITRCDEENLQLLMPFVHYFEKKIDVIKQFNYYIDLFIVKTRIELPLTYSVDELTLAIFNFLVNLVDNYGSLSVHLFAQQLKRNLTIFKQTEIEICFNLLENHPNADVAVLVLSIIDQPYDEERRKACNNIFRLIKDIRHPGVQILLNCKCRDFSNSEHFLV